MNKKEEENINENINVQPESVDNVVENKKDKKSKKEKKNKKEKNENKVSLGEKISLKFRRRWLVDGAITFIIVIYLFVMYIAINFGIGKIDLPEIDITENQLYTLTDTSKEAIKKIDNEVKMYVYGFDEKSTVIDLLKQYNKANDKIIYEILTEESNYEMIQEYELSEGYPRIIIKSGDSEKVIDASTDFITYDYVTYQTVDTTEQTLTNSILALNSENKPNVYFVQGHGEYDSNTLITLTTYLQNESFEVKFINLATAGEVPEDCDVLVIMSPTSDLYDIEAESVRNYINRGGNIYLGMDVISQKVQLTNLQSILDEYGVSVENGYIIENQQGSSLPNYPYIFMPDVSTTNEITKDIYTDSFIWLVYSARLNFKSDEELENINVEKETLLTSSEESTFIKDLTQSLSSASDNTEKSSSTISAILTKNLETSENEAEDGENVENTDLQSKLIIVSSASFISDYQISALSQSKPLSYLGSNKDFVINSMAYLGDKENILTIRKDYASSTYMPTRTQNIVVISIISLVPLFIIVFGIVVSIYRKKRK